MKTAFKVKDAIAALKSEEDPEILYYNLLRCLSWAFLDQEAGDRKSRKKGRTKNARRAGRLALAEQVDDVLSKVSDRRRKLSPKEVRTIRTFSEFGGFSRLSRDPSFDHQVAIFKRERLHTSFVFRIVQFLCRAEIFGLPKRQRTVAFAKEFISRGIDGATVRNSSTISQQWEKYAPAAALIFATYLIWPNASACTARCARRDIRSLSRNRAELLKFIGYASHAATVISKTSAQKAFTKSFFCASPVVPRLVEFSPKEIEELAKF